MQGNPKYAAALTTLESSTPRTFDAEGAQLQAARNYWAPVVCGSMIMVHQGQMWPGG